MLPPLGTLGQALVGKLRSRVPVAWPKDKVTFKNLIFLSPKICWRSDRLPTPVFLGFPCGSVGKESTYNVGDLGSIPGLGKYPEEGKVYPL